MNKKDKNPDYKRLYSIVCGLFNKTQHFKHGPWDETYFTLRVFESAKEIMKLVKGKYHKQAILAAAILHDVGKTKLDMENILDYESSLCFGTKNWKKEWRKHPGLSVPISKKILKKEGYSDEFIREVLYLVENHDRRDDKNIEASLDLKILQDADLIADCGYAGFIRPFLFAGKFSYANTIQSIRFIQKEENRVEKDNLLNLKESLRIAKKKMKLQKKLVDEISKDIDSELLK